MDFVTSRNKLKSQSNFDLSRNLSDDDHNSTMMDSSMRSLPNLSVDCEEITELKLKLEQMVLELDGAHLEIENLNIENSRLKQEVENNKKQIETLKKITEEGNTGSTGKSKTKKKRQKRDSLMSDSLRKDNKKEKCSKKLNYEEESKEEFCTLVTDENTSACDDSIIKENDKNDNSDTSNVQIQDIHTDKIINDTNIYIKNSDNYTENKINQDNYSNTDEPKHKVIILADEQGRGLQASLQKLLGTNYKVFSYFKPGASSGDILDDVNVLTKEFTKEDYLIILAGKNDRNPRESSSILFYNLSKTKHTNVIVSEIPYNRIVNEYKLNNEIKCTCSIFKHSEFVDMGFSTFIPNRSRFLNHITRRLLKEILRLGYRNNYHNYLTNLRYIQNIQKTKQFNDANTQTDDIILNENTDTEKIHDIINKVPLDDSNENNLFREKTQ